MQITLTNFPFFGSIFDFYLKRKLRNPLQHIAIHQHQLTSGRKLDINLSYQTFGQDLLSAPIVLINHALTGNSGVCGDNGWWNRLVGKTLPVDLRRFAVLCFNIPGNGYDGVFIDDTSDITTKDIASIFLEGLKFLKIEELFALIGGSIGGAIGWEMLVQQQSLAKYFIPIATDFKTSDWLHSQCLVQQFLLESEKKPLEKARIHAMLCYRTPESINFRFKNENDAEKQIRKSECWLNFHGKTLNERFSLQAYRFMNHLLMNIGVPEVEIKYINAEIHLIAIDTDLFFPAFEIKRSFDLLQENKQNVYYHELKSIHGHDAFLMEYEQLNQILKPIFYEK